MTTIHRLPEIVTLGDAMSYLGMGDSATDAVVGQLQSLKRKAEAAVRKFLRCNVVRNTYTHYLPKASAFDLVHSGPRLSEDGWGVKRQYLGPVIYLPQYPIRSITSLYEDTGGRFGQKSGQFTSDSLLTEGDDYMWTIEATGFGRTGVVQRIGAYWPSTPGSIKVTYLAGWTKHELHGDTDEEEKDGSLIQMGVLKTIAEYWSDKKQAEGGVDGAPGPIKSESLADYSVTYDTSHSGAGVELPEDVKVELRPFRRIANIGAVT